MPSALASQWTLDPKTTYLNHGSFGACPRAVLEVQTRLRTRLESEPARFFLYDLEPLLDEARVAVASFVGADPDDLAFVPNATAGVNAILRSLVFAPGDEILVTSHTYNACRVTADHVAARAGARVVAAPLPFAGSTPDRVIEAIVAAASPRTRLALIDHVCAPTGFILPIADIVAALAARGIDTLVDGAHAAGMVPLDVRALGAAYYVGHGHKWLCAPKGAAFLVARRDRQEGLVPITISHGANSTRTDRSRFRLLFDWTGTIDPTPWLALPSALSFMGGLVDGGWPALMARNRALALEARQLLADALQVELPAPAEMVGALAALRVPSAFDDPAAGYGPGNSLQRRLFEAGFEVVVMPWAPHGQILRVSAQLYNDRSDYERLATTLVAMMKRA